MTKEKKHNEEVEEVKNGEETTGATAENTEGNAEEKAEEVVAEEVQPTIEDELAKTKDQYLRLSAEFDNYRKRTLKEKMELTKSAGASLLVNLLPVMDDFERAMQSMETSDAAAVKEGIDLIYNKFNEYLKQNGVTEIEAKEVEFDTDHHEALTKIPAPTEELKGKVVDVIQKGYTMNDKVIRFAKVVVGE